MESSAASADDIRLEFIELLRSRRREAMESTANPIEAKQESRDEMLAKHRLAPIDPEMAPINPLYYSPPSPNPLNFTSPVLDLSRMVGKRKKRHLAALIFAGRRVTLNLFAEPTATRSSFNSPAIRALTLTLEMEEPAAKEAGGGEENLMAVLDFDMLCAIVALQTQGMKTEKWAEEDGDFQEEFGGVQRLWEGTVLDCLADCRIVIEAFCCPCFRFGKNPRRANLGYCFL